MTTTTQKCLFATALVLVGLVIIAGILFWKPGVQNYPRVLVETDSAYMQGYFERGDSLLACYQSQKQEESMPVRCYRQFLELTQKYLHIQLDENHFSDADSLERYYKGTGEGSKHARTLLFLGNLYAENGNNPTALDYFLRAIQEAKQTKDTHLECLINYELADLYFKQLMYDDCVPYYQNYYRLAVACHDTLRMANGSYCMGLVWTIKNDVDSAIFYHHQAIRLEQEASRKLGVIRIAEYRLCDLYIQIEEYDSAKAIMPRDLLNYENWAYWHYWQNNQDSAAYYFQAMLDYDGWKAKTEHLKILIQIMESQNRQQDAMDYYRQLVAAEDSLKNSLQVEGIRKANTQYSYAAIRKERDEMAQSRRTLQQYSIGISLVALVLLVLSSALWKSHKRAVEKKLVHQKIVEQELENRALALKNQSNEAKEQRQELLNELYRSELFHRLKSTDGKVRRQLSEKEWDYLVGHYLDPIYDHLTNRLTAVAQLSITELRICYLVKLGVTPTAMADILSKTKGAISQARKRMYQKMTGQQGGAERFDELMRVF